MRSDELKMSILDAEKKLFEEWSRCRRPFVSDGVVSETDYQKSSPKIAFILKEVNDKGGGDWDLREFLRNGGCDETWNNVTIWVHGMRSLPTIHEWSFYEKITEDFRKEILKSIVAMNLKKSPGGHTTNPSELNRVANEDRDYIQRQYAIYDPDITVCGGTGDLFKKVVGHQMGWQTITHKTTEDEVRWYGRNADKYVVDYWHPQLRNRKSEEICRLLLDVVCEINLVVHAEH